MEVISINVLFAHSLNATISKESISADFESLNWRFINKFCETLINYLAENDCEIHENLIKNILFNENKTTIVGGLSFSVKSSHLIFNQLIVNFLNTIIHNGAKESILCKGDVSESIYEFLLKYSSTSSKAIKYPLKLIAEGITYPIYGSFAKLEIPLDEDDEVEVFEVIARVDQPTYTSKHLLIVLEDGSKIPNIHYKNYEFHEIISELYRSQSFVRFTLSNKKNAKGKKICTLENVS